MRQRGGKQKRIAPMWLRKWIEKGRMVMPSHPINDRQRKKIEYQLFTGKDRYRKDLRSFWLFFVFMFLWFWFKIFFFSFFFFFFYYEQRNEEDAIEVMWTNWLNCRIYVEKPNSFQATEFNTKCCGCDPTFPIVKFEWRRRWWQLKGKAYLGSDKTF